MTDDRGRLAQERAGKRSATAVQTFLSVLAAVILSASTAVMVQGSWALGMMSLVWGLCLLLLAYRWPRLTSRLDAALARSISEMAANAWSWLILVVILAEAILFLSFAEKVNSPKGLARQQAVAVNAGTQIIQRRTNLAEIIWQDGSAGHQPYQRFEAIRSAVPHRSKLEIDDLITKSNELLEITRTGVPLFQEWQSLLTTNPERVCVGLDLEDLVSTSTRLADEFRKAQAAQQRFFDSNSSKSAELLPLISNGAVPASSSYVEEFEVASDALGRYAQWMRGLNDRPTCENIVQTGEIATQSLNINQALWRLGYWLGLTDDRVKKFQLGLLSEEK